MQRFFLHIVTGEEEIRDSEGQLLPNLEAARAEAIAGARSILSQEVLLGVLPLDERIDIADEKGDVLLSVSFLEAINIRTTGLRNRD